MIPRPAPWSLESGPGPETAWVEPGRQASKAVCSKRGPASRLWYHSVLPAVQPSVVEFLEDDRGSFPAGTGTLAVPFGLGYSTPGGVSSRYG